MLYGYISDRKALRTIIHNTFCVFAFVSKRFPRQSNKILKIHGERKVSEKTKSVTYYRIMDMVHISGFIRIHRMAVQN